MSDDLTTLGSARLSKLIRAREMSPREVVEAHLDRVADLDPLLAAFITRMADQARAEAREAEAEIARGHHRGPLHGVPFAVKDIIDVADVETTGGSRVLAGNIARKDAACVARLRKRWRNSARQADDVRDGDRRAVLRSALATATQSLARRPRERRLEQRLGGSGGGRSGPVRARL